MRSIFWNRLVERIKRKFSSCCLLLGVLGSVNAQTSKSSNVPPLLSKPKQEVDQKIRGIHFFPDQSNMAEEYAQLRKQNMEWIVLVPSAWQEGVHSTTIDWPFDEPDNPFNDAALITQIRQAHSKDLKICIKPHIWLRKKDKKNWRGTIQFKSVVDWSAWSKQYREAILHYAQLSQKHQVAAFCIGTELHQLAIKYPDYWRSLIREVKTIFDGKIIYAANWDREYKQIAFWDELDYIGIQAYFPLCRKDNPRKKQVYKGWKSYLKDIEGISRKFNKPILFTEIGYTNSSMAACEPWEWVRDLDPKKTSVSDITQANCYDAFFSTFWDRSWFGGVFMWVWENEPANEQSPFTFCPKNKPANAVMHYWFSKTVNVN